jgi:hypothetical protein
MHISPVLQLFACAERAKFAVTQRRRYVMGAQGGR